MTFSALHGLAAGALVTGALVAFVLHPAALVPHAVATPALALPGDDAPPHPARAARPRRPPSSCMSPVRWRTRASTPFRAPRARSMR